jgi:predicted metalloprotease
MPAFLDRVLPMVQQFFKEPYPGVAAPRDVQLVLSADCMAGAWAKYAREKGWLEYPDDVQDINSLVRAIGSREGPGRDHGTAAERSTAFEQGFDTGLSACNRYSL